MSKIAERHVQGLSRILDGTFELAVSQYALNVIGTRLETPHKVFPQAVRDMWLTLPTKPLQWPPCAQFRASWTDRRRLQPAGIRGRAPEGEEEMKMKNTDDILRRVECAVCGNLFDEVPRIKGKDSWRMLDCRGNDVTFLTILPSMRAYSEVSCPKCGAWNLRGKNDVHFLASSLGALYRGLLRLPVLR